MFLLTDNMAFAQTNTPSTAEQMKANQDLTTITCKEGYVILTKQDSTSACVSPTTYLRLIDRGWGMWDRSIMNHPLMINNVMNQMMQNPQMMQQWHDMMMQNPQQMENMREQWFAKIKEDPQIMANIMGPMTTDPELQQKMIEQMIQHQEMMQSMRANNQWMGMMMKGGGPMMGQGMHGSGMGMGQGAGGCPWCPMSGTTSSDIQYGTTTCLWCPVMTGTNQPMTMNWNMHNPQHVQNMMNQMWQDPQWREQMNNMMIQNPWHMGSMMNQIMGSMMGPMMSDPQLRQQMLDMMSQNLDFMQNLKQNPQFLDEIKEDDDDYKENERNEINLNSQNTQVSIALGSASPGCENTNDCYIPYSVSITEHSSVTWFNDDMSVHTATSGIPANGPDGIFDSGLIPPGDTYTNQFDEEGTFDYYCIAHPWMIGKVMVID